MLVGVFTAIKVFNWVATLYRGAIAFKTPLIYICGFLFFFVFGGMTGIAVATVSLDVHWHDTYFVVAHFHFIMVGAAIMAFLVALHYWFPKMFGRMYHEGWGLVAASLIVLGFNATFIPQFLLGNAGHAAPLLHVPGALPGAQRGLDRRRLAAGLRLHHHPHLSHLRARPRQGGRRQPVGLARLRVDDHLAAARSTTSTHPGDHRGFALLPGAGRGGGACRHLTRTPTNPHLAHHFETIEKQDYAVRLGMWLFLGTEVLLFAGLFLGYTVYRHFYHEAFHEASRHLDLWAGTTNTVVLITSSLTVALAYHAIKQNKTKQCAGAADLHRSSAPSHSW